jgi:hypothetical protein
MNIPPITLKPSEITVDTSTITPPSAEDIPAGEG